MDSSFGALDAFAFVVFAVLIFVGVIIVVNLGKLPGQLARRWNYPQAGAINAMSWVGIATGGLLWPVAFVWAFTKPFGLNSGKQNAPELLLAGNDAKAASRQHSAEAETRV